MDHTDGKALIKSLANFLVVVNDRCRHFEL